MKFLPTIDLWQNGVEDAIIRGNLKLQRGQWIKCGNEKPSRYFGLTKGGCIWAIHPSPDQADRFIHLCKSYQK